MARSSRKYYRTIFLGVAAMAALVWAAIEQFGIPWQDMLHLLLLTVAGIALVIAAAAIAVALWMGVRSLLRKEE